MLVNNKIPNFWKIYQSLIDEWVADNREITCNEDYEVAILYTLERVYEMTKKGEI